MTIEKKLLELSAGVQEVMSAIAHARVNNAAELDELRHDICRSLEFVREALDSLAHDARPYTPTDVEIQRYRRGDRLGAVHQYIERTGSSLSVALEILKERGKCEHANAVPGTTTAGTETCRDCGAVMRSVR